jgi:hypothetical protein
MKSFTRPPGVLCWPRGSTGGALWYGVALNQYNEVTLDPVKTTELKMEIKFHSSHCGSLIRWRVE